MLGITCQPAASSPSQTRFPESERSVNSAKHQSFRATLEGGRGLGLYVFAVRHVWLGMKKGWEFAQSLCFSEKEEAADARMWGRQQVTVGVLKEEIGHHFALLLGVWGTLDDISFCFLAPRASDKLFLLDQCEKYRRCRQCQRRTSNVGESNVWPLNKFLQGSRLLV